MKKLTVLLKAALPFMRDLHIYVGGLFVSIGLAFWWPPAGLIAFGVVLLGRGAWRMK